MQTERSCLECSLEDDEVVIPDETLEKIALTVTESLNLNSGEAVFIIGGDHTHQLIESVALQVYKKGGLPQFSSLSDSYLRRLFTTIPEENLAKTPHHYVALIKSSDAYVLIDFPADPALFSQVDSQKVAARRNAYVPVTEALFNPETGKKWCFVAWPTVEASRYYHIDPERFYRMLIQGILAPREEIQKRCQHTAELLSGGTEVQVNDDYGTDFRVNITGRRVHKEDGFVSQDDLEKGDRGNNLPCGEVCVAPHETVGEGVLYSPLVSDSLSNTLLRDVVLQFKEGRLILEKCEARENCDVLVKSFHTHMAIDREQYGEPRTLNVAELGVGLNPHMTEHIGYILTDEKIEGTAHLAFGMSDALGGTSRSSLHWDFVTGKGVTIEVTKEDGSCCTIMKKGKLGR